MRYLHLLTIMTIVLILSNITWAKCPIEYYVISGKVVDISDLPVDDAKVSVFFDDNKQGFYGVSVSDGKFYIEAAFDTYIKMGLTGDKCGRKPKILTIVLAKHGYFSRLVEYEIKKNDISNREIIINDIRLIKAQ